MEFYSCSFTGHRKIDESHIKKVTEIVFRAVNYAYERGVRDFYCGGALGFDTISAQQVVIYRMDHKDVKLHLVLPCRNQNDRWSERQKDMYCYLLSVADTVEYISDGYVNGCMQMRNKRLVELCDMLVAYVGRETGGSAQTLRIAKKSGKTVFNIFETVEKEIEKY